MRLKISDIPEEHSALAGTLEIGSDDGESTDPIGRGIACKTEIDRMGSQIRFQIAYAGAVQLRCSRCLSPFEASVSGEFLLVHSEESPAPGDEEEDEADARTYISDDWIDFGAAVRDEILTGLPMKPLCSEDCRGGDFAPVTSQTAAVLDDAKGVDPRWDALRKLQAGRG